MFYLESFQFFQNLCQLAIAFFKAAYGIHDFGAGVLFTDLANFFGQAFQFVGMGGIVVQHVADQRQKFILGRDIVAVGMYMIVAVAMLMGMFMVMNVLMGMGVGMFMLMVVVMAVTVIVVCAVGMGMNVGMLVYVRAGMGMIVVTVVHGKCLLVCCMAKAHCEQYAFRI